MNRKLLSTTGFFLVAASILGSLAIPSGQGSVARMGVVSRMEGNTDSGPASTGSTGASEADAAFNEKSYSRALELYRNALANTRVADKDEVEFRIAVALGKTEQWDAAIAAGNALLGHTAWKARVQYWLGRLYTVMPHTGYKVGGRIYRGNDYPKTLLAEKPVMVYLDPQDADATSKFFELAKVNAPLERRLVLAGDFGASTHALTRIEEVDLNFDLAAWLPQHRFPQFVQQLEKDGIRDETVDVTQPYNPAWQLPKKVLYLYDQVAVLDKTADKHKSALALLARGMFVQAYRQQMDGWAQYYDKQKQQWVKRRYPFDAMTALAVWQQLVAQFPDDPIAEHAQLDIAHAYYEKGDRVSALAAYKALLTKYPKSKWTSDARAQIQEIEKHELSLDTMGAQPPGKASTVTVYTRNLKEVEFSVFKVKLEDVLTQPSSLNEWHNGFTDFSTTFGSIESAQKYFGARVADWTFHPKDKGDYQPSNETTEVPVKELGAYVLVARGAGVRFARLLIISDLAILKKVDRDSAFAYIADARTGKPLAAANVVMREQYYENGNWKVSVVRGVSNESGFFDKKLTTGAGISSGRVETFAWVGNRYALTGANGGCWWGYGDNRQELKVYAYTDRPVYRPSQVVYFRQILTRRIKGGDVRPATGVKLHVRVSNPKGTTIYDQVLTASEFGTVNGQLTLETGAALGEYYINAETGETNQNIASSGGNRFRVEEYKRPEFQVNIDAPDHAVRPGETVAAKINAKYYFGSPVPNATVKYTVRRSSWWAGYHFPTPFDWLYSYWGAGDYNSGRRNIGGEGSGAIVKEGKVKTDSEGNAEVSFAATADKVTDSAYGWWWRRYSNPLYTIEAEVTDASRRTIEGQGSVRVANQQYFAFLNTTRGYYRSGDRVPIELVTQDANDKPAAASGRMVVYRLLPGDAEKKVYSEIVTTPRTGRTTWTWHAEEGGQFRIAFEATDDWGQPVVGSTELWVAGPGLDSSEFRLQGVTIIVDKNAYQEGDTLHALLVADQPGTTVLLTEEAGGEIFKRQLLSIEGKSREITIPIAHEHVPNFVIAAALVKNYEVYQAQQEVIVPPTKQLINVSVTSDKATYKPGETGLFHIRATNWSGTPARAEVSVALADASLFYIQKDYAPDIRTFYYGERRADSVNLDSYKTGVPQGQREDDQEYQQYEQHGWELPDDLGELNLPPGSFGYYYGNERFNSLRGMAMEDSAGVEGPRAPMSVSAASLAVESRLSNLETRASAKAAAPGAISSAAPAQVRSNFAETAFWSPSVVTENGAAEVKVTFPDSLTQWHATVRGLTQNASVGAGEGDVVTRKNLLVRMQAPRFFVQRDQVVLTANVHNYLKSDQRVKVTLNTGPALRLSRQKIGSIATGTDMLSTSGYVLVKAGEEARVNWLVDAVEEGRVNVQMTAQTAVESDAVKMSFPVLVHGVQRFAAQSGVIRNGAGVDTQTVMLNYPAQRRLGASSLNVQLNPSLAATMLDALPYLADYPYGCVEQTMSRFLPTVVAARTLSDNGIDLATLRARAKAYEAEAKTPAVAAGVLNSAYSYPGGMPNSRDLHEMASQLYPSVRGNNPLFDKAEMNSMIAQGLQRLYAMQRGDGGWGWWAGSPQSDTYMSAYVMYGLATARAAEVAVRPDVLERGYAYLAARMKVEDNIHLLTAVAYSLSLRGTMSPELAQIASGRLFTQRERLSAYSKSLLAMALWNIGEKQKAGVLVRNLEDTAKVDAANGTSRWRIGSDWWNWWNNDVETNAIALRAFLQVDPTNKLVPMMMKWLTLQARGNHWRSTKETAEAVYALADYVRVNKELDVDYTITVDLNGKVRRSYHVTSQNALYFDNRFISGDLMLENGANKLTISKRGRGNLYWNAYSEYFSLEEPIKASGNELAVKRRFFKLTRNPRVKAEQVDEGNTSASPTPVLRPMGGAMRMGAAIARPLDDVPAAEPEYLRSELKDGDVLKSGDLVEVELIVDSANDYEYLVFEDMKAAGLEPVELRSGNAGGDGISSNVELRDDRVAFFVDRLPQGTRALRYRLRAEAPGLFHALPTNAYAMYAPEVRAISDEQRLHISD